MSALAGLLRRGWLRPGVVEVLEGKRARIGQCRVEASLDGRTFAAVPLTRVVRGPDGRNVIREVPVSEYRALRWPLGSLSSRQSRAVTARVRIQPTEVAALTR